MGIFLKIWSQDSRVALGASSQSCVQHFSQTDVTLPTSHHLFSCTKDLFRWTTDDLDKRHYPNAMQEYVTPPHNFPHFCSEASYGSHTNTNRMLETSSHMGSKHLLTFAGPNGVAHTNLMNGMNFEGGDEERMEEMVDLSQIQAELMLDVNAQEMMMTEYPADCCPVKCYIHLPCIAGEDDSPFWQGWANLRIKTFRLIENKYFETAVITMILVSSLALAAEDIHLEKRPVLQDILYYMDRIFTVIFTMEMVVKWLALGFVKYFTNAWCWLDFVIVMVSSPQICFYEQTTANFSSTPPQEGEIS